MTSVFFKSRDAASPWMVLMSVCLHAVGILAIVAVSFTISTSNKPVETPVTIVSAPIAPPQIETMQNGPVELPSDLPVQEVMEAPLPSKDVSEAPRETVDQSKLNQSRAEPIPLTKRKKPMKPMEAEKPVPKPKEPEKKKEIAQKKEDPKDYLAQRMAALSKEVEEKKKKSQSVGPATSNKGASGQQGGAGADVESARWINAVKSRIKSHWSLMGDARQEEKLAKIGVQIAEDGQLLNTTVDVSSRDRMFDDSALRAVYQAAPFPPLPPQVKAWISQEGGLTLKFTSRGIQ